MKCYKKPFLSIIFLCFTLSLSKDISFKEETINNSFIFNETKISYHQDNSTIGYAEYTKIPLVAFYVIHSLYIFPAFRNKGYGTRLLEHVGEVLKQKGAHKLYIQPGPFEHEENAPHAALTMEQLVLWYKKLGFIPVNKIISFFAAYLYKLLDIPEDSRYLMVKNL